MFLNNEYYYFNKAINKKTCNKIIQLGNKNFNSSSIDETKTKKIDKNIRVSDTAWSTEQWLYDLIIPYVAEANEKAGWKYDIKAIESLQITRYKKGGFYKFHKDCESDNLNIYNDPTNKIKHGNIRKLSISIILNNNYKGGDFQIVVLEGAKSVVRTPDINKVGSIIVFPSFITHRVKPVIEGIRYSLVAWFVGPPFK
jgi:PKHD-type hydroxylase